MTSYLGASDVREIADALGVRPTKTLGQNFVHDAGTVRKIVRTAHIQPGEWVLEVGPGLGSLTLGLLDAGASVSAVEIDPVLVQALPGTVAARFSYPGRLAVLLRDAMEVGSAADLPVPEGVSPEAAERGPVRLVANLPYNVATPIVLTLLERLPSLREVLVMVQAEVADRLAAEPGSRTYGAPSAKAAWWGNASRAGTIGRAVFWPVPNVDSALVRLVRHDDDATLGGLERTEELRRETFAVIDAAFAQRRKTLRQALAPWAGSPARAEELLEAAGVDPAARGETLYAADFARVAAAALDAGSVREASDVRSALEAGGVAAREVAREADGAASLETDGVAARETGGAAEREASDARSARETGGVAECAEASHVCGAQTETPGRAALVLEAGDAEEAK